MRLRSFAEFLEKEIRELFASRAFWLMLLIVGVLVGHLFITAVATYSEMSGSGGAPAALPQALTPLDGILVPTWGAYDLIATLLFPFVAIRLIATEKESGGIKLLLQLPGSLFAKVAAKGAVLIVAWLIAWVPGLVAIGLWRSYGGHVDAVETLNLLLGHLLRGLLSAGVGVSAAAMTESAASAAIITLGITVGTWALDFMAAGRGGLLRQLSNYTPTAILRSFEQGLLRANSVVIILVLSLAGFALASIWLQVGRSIKLRTAWTMLLLILAAAACLYGAHLNASWDMSENRRNSFAPVDDKLLMRIDRPLKITVYLSPEDPRLTDYEQNVLKRLRRVFRHLEVDYASNSTTGLFEGAADHYGEIWYQMNDEKAMERSTIEEVVLDQIYQLAKVEPPVRTEENSFSGYPLAVQPKRAAMMFYLEWPLLVAVTWWFCRK